MCALDKQSSIFSRFLLSNFDYHSVYNGSFVGWIMWWSLQACAVMALERVPADIRKQGGVARMTDPKVHYNNIILFYLKLV